MEERLAAARRRSEAASRPASALSTSSAMSSSSRAMMPPPPLPALSSARRHMYSNSSQHPSSDVYDNGPSSDAQSIGTSSRYTVKPRPSTVSLGSSSVAGDDHARRGKMSATSRARRLQDLVAATASITRGRRSDAAESSSRQQERARLVNMAEDVLEDYASTSIPLTSQDEDRFISSLKRKIRSQNQADVASSAIRLETAISRLRRAPGMAADMPALLAFLDSMAFADKDRPSSVRGGERGSPLLMQQATRPRSNIAAIEQPILSGPSLLARPSSQGGSGREPLLDRINSPLPSLYDSQRARAAETPKKDANAPAAHPEAEVVAEVPEPAVDYDEPTVPRATLLQRWREAQGRALIPEDELLQDVLYLLQGINGRHVGFEEEMLLPSTDLGDAHDPEQIVKVCFYGEAAKRTTAPTQHLIHRIAELGRLYKRVDMFLTEQSQREGSGLIMQSLCHFLSSEMTDYYRLVAILEAKMKQRGTKGPESTVTSSAASGLTLKRIAAWTEDVLLRMRLTSTIIESCRDAHGGEIISLIHSYTFHGDPLVRSFTASILDHVSRPFFHTLSKWIFEGELQDPFGEFFVELSGDKGHGSISVDESSHDAVHYPSARQEEGQPLPADPSSVWQHKFKFRSRMLPSYLDESFGRKIFSTGKSLHFIRFSCGDSDWVSARSSMHRNADIPALRYADLAGFERTIDDAYAVASTRLLDIFLDKFKLLEHLRALKDYLMLARGDFVDLLMESIGPSLDRPAVSLFRHNLTASLETAIRGSNSQFDDADIVGRLDARILEFGDNDLGWDTFTLEYRVDEPVNTVLDSHAMLGYQVIFSHLWKIKRVELALGASWERLLLAANTIRRVLPRKYTRRPGRHGRASVLSNVAAIDDGPHGHRALVHLSTETLGQLKEQIHFVKQMQGYINLEVIEYSWNDLTQLFASHAEGRRRLDLDELIQSHRAYLNTLLAKVLLRGSSKERKRPGESQDYLAHEVKRNLDTMLVFTRASDSLAAHVTEHAAKYSLLSQGVDEEEDEEAQVVEHAAIDAIRVRLAHGHDAFSQSTLLILSKLERHSNLVVRDLATRVNFNSYYQTSTLASSSHRRTPAPASAVA